MKNSRYAEIDVMDFAALVREKVRQSTQACKTVTTQHSLSHSVRTELPYCGLADDSVEQLQQSLVELKRVIELFSCSTAVAEFVPRKDRTYSLNELLKYEDRSFVRAAYVATLGRPPDTKGEASYLGHLRSGMPKYQILVHLAASEEGKRYGAKLRGLASTVSLKNWYEVPVIGRLLSLFIPAVDLNTLERKISVVEGGFARARESFLQAPTHFLGEISSIFVQRAIFRKQLRTELNALIARVEEVETHSKLASRNNPRIADLSPSDDFSRIPRGSLDLAVCFNSHVQRWRAESNADK